jgi:hypothetical protein
MKNAIIMKTFDIKIKYDDNYSDVEVLQSIMGNIDIGLYERIGIRFSVERDLKERYDKFIER